MAAVAAVATARLAAQAAPDRATVAQEAQVGPVTVTERPAQMGRTPSELALISKAMVKAGPTTQSLTMAVAAAVAAATAATAEQAPGAWAIPRTPVAVVAVATAVTAVTAEVLAAVVAAMAATVAQVAVSMAAVAAVVAMA